MKKFLVIFTVFVIALSLVLVACTEVKVQNPTPSVDVKLSQPQGLKINVNALISWGSVSGATSYELTINGEKYTTTQTSYQADKMLDFTVSVVAKGEGYLDSDPSTSKFESIWKQDKPVVEDPKDIVLGIEGNSHVNSNESVTLKANVSGTDNKEVTWEIVTGSEYVSIDENGVITASDVSDDKFIKVKCTSKANTEISATKLLVLRARTVLTQEMLDEIASLQVLSYVGYLNINVYTPGLTPKLVRTITYNIETAMDGENWFAKYEDSMGLNQQLHYKNHNGYANQIGLSLMNDELYSPMFDEADNKVSWADAGLYNNFGGLSVSDFTFDEEEWRWKYKGHDADFMKKMVASSNPYDFDPRSFSLIIDHGEIVGFYALANDDYTIYSQHNSIQELFVGIAFGDTVNVPKITKYSTEDIHTELNEAITNMHALSSYKVTVRESIRNIYSSIYSTTGYYEYITADICHFEPFEYTINGRQEEIILPVPNQSYGYKKINDNLYNSYFENRDGSFSVSRAYETEFTDARPSFGFAAEIFRSYYINEQDGSITYYVDELMNSVATTFYKGLGNEVALYGLFATMDTQLGYTPYVTVKDGYIVDSGFYFYLGSLWGTISMEYSDFNETEVPTGKNIEFETRTVPVSWSELTIIVNDSDTTTDDEEVNALDFLKEFYGNEEIEEYLPFFGNVLGDTFGFAMTSYYRASDGITHRIVNMYYDVPLDLDYTINTSMNAVKDYLDSEGFKKNAAGEYENGNIVVLPVETDLDFFIYVWKK